MDDLKTGNRVKATLIRGDGIGPEVLDVAVSVMEALGAPFEWEERDAGLGAFEKHGTPVPEDTLESVRRTGLSLKGPLQTPFGGGGYRSASVTLREELDVYANVRPARTIVKGGRYEDIDLVLIRENLEGMYVGFEHYVRVGDDPHAVAIGTGVNTRAGATRIAEYAFAYAERYGRRKVTAVHKANVLKLLSGIFLEAAREVAKRYEGRVEFEEMVIDACAMKLVLDPSRFDVIVATNLFGDILSDLIAGLIGGLGFAPGANIGAHAAMFEAVHGSAPDIAGKNIANPTAVLLASALMLEHIGADDQAKRMRRAIGQAIESGARTPDLGGTTTTRDFGRAVIERLGE